MIRLNLSSLEVSNNLKKVTINELDVNGDTVARTDQIKFLGGYLDANLTLKKHINIKCRTALTNWNKIKSMRNILTQEATQTLVLGLCILHHDYCNAFLVGLPNCDIKKFQCVQNMCAELVLDHDKYSSSTQALADLHWLNIRLHISFKIVSLVHQCVCRTAPSYLQDLIVKLPVRRPGLRLNDSSNILLVPRVTKQTFTAHSFSKRPKLWNMLPENIRMIDNYDQFKSKHKTFLFTNTNFY